MTVVTKEQAYTYDVFISYSHADERWVTKWLVPHLKEVGLRVCIDQDDFEIGVPSVINMERAVEKSRKTLLVLTPNWVTSEWTNFEALLLFTYDPIGQSRRILPLILKKCELPKRLSMLTYADFTKRNRWEREFQRISEAIGGSVIAKSTIARLIPFVLPQQAVSTFIGRIEELRRLEELLLNRKGSKMCSIVGLAGSGGVGKTQLACQFAELYRDRFPDGVIGLRVDGKDADTLAREFARCCGEEIGSEDERDASTIMQEVFGERHALLIFDNADSSIIKSLRPTGDKCAVIITTRDRGLPFLLDISSEGMIDLPPLPDQDSLLLLERILGRDRVTAEQESAKELIKLAGNLPLALQVVGAALQTQEFLSLSDYAASLRSERKRFEVLSIKSNVHLDVRASFSLSLKLLDSLTVDFFACLSVCAADGFSMQAAMASGNCDEFTAHRHLSYLYRLSLLNRPQLGVNRFVFHPLIRIFAKELAIERSLQEGAGERHAQFFIGLVKSSDINDPAVASAIAEELDDIKLAADWLQSQGSFDEALDVLQLSYLISEQVDDQQEQATVLNSIGGVLQMQGDYDKAIDAFRRSSSISEQLGDQIRQAMAINRLGGALQRQGKFDEAVDAFQRVYDLFETLDDRKGQATVLNSLGGVLQRQGRFDEAVDVFTRSEILFEELKDHRSQAMVLNSLGGVLQRQGRFDKAFDSFQRSQAIYEVVEDLGGLAMVLNSLGGVLQRRGRFDEALAAFRRSYDLLVALDDMRGQAMVLNSLGGVLQRQGSFDEALDVFQRSVEIETKLGNSRGQAMVLNSLGGVFQRLGRFDEALDAFQKSYSISHQLGDQRSLAMVLNSLGGVFQRQGRFDEALAAFRSSYDLLVALDDLRGQAMVLNSLGGVLQRQGSSDEAVDVFQRSLSIGERFEDKRHLAMVYTSLGRALQSNGDVEQAAVSLQRAFEIDEELRNASGLRSVTPVLAHLLLELGRKSEALDYCNRALIIAPKDTRVVKLWERLSAHD